MNYLSRTRSILHQTPARGNCRPPDEHPLLRDLTHPKVSINLVSHQ
jgi:hypothetical protein